jgi:hypothetical protein
LLEQVGVGEGSGRPDRVAYRITGEGETEFEILLVHGLSQVYEDANNGHQLVAAITFMPPLPREGDQAVGVPRQPARNPIREGGRGN